MRMVHLYTLTSAPGPTPGTTVRRDAAGGLLGPSACSVLDPSACGMLDSSAGNLLDPDRFEDAIHLSPGPLYVT